MLAKFYLYVFSNKITQSNKMSQHCFVLLFMSINNSSRILFHSKEWKRVDTSTKCFCSFFGWSYWHKESIWMTLLFTKTFRIVNSSIVWPHFCLSCLAFAALVTYYITTTKYVRDLDSIKQDYYFRLTFEASHIVWASCGSRLKIVLNHSHLS